MNLVDLSELQQTYKLLESQNDLFELKKETLQIPINLNVYRTTQNIFRANYGINYKYLDQYSFQDKVLIYDYKTGFSKNKIFSNFFTNLKRHNIQTYFGKEKTYNSELVIKRNEHVDWIDNNSNLKLSDILNVEPSHISPFSPAQKYIFLNYNHIHTANVNVFFFYTSPKEKNKNIYSKIKYGKLKTKHLHASNLFSKATKIDSNFCWTGKKPLEMTAEQIQMTEDMEEGYEGACDRINMHLQKHPDFLKSNSQKWSTPYVSYNFKYSHSTGRKEYYHYLLGEYSNNYGKSENLLSDQKNKNIWFLDYDNIFKIDVDSYGFSISLDNSKISNNYYNFLKISTLFDFEFSYKDQAETKKLTFDLAQILSKKSKIYTNVNEILFSDFSVSLKPKANKKSPKIEFMNDLKTYKYKVNIDSLIENNFWLDHIFIDEKNVEKYLPSQLLDDAVLSNHVFFSSNKFRKFKFSPDELENLNIHKEFNDEDGIMKIRYFDYLEKKYKDIYWSNMKKIPSDGRIRVLAKNLEEAKIELRKRFQLPEYFWNSIEITTEKEKNMFEDYIEYKIFPIHDDPRVRKQWNLINSEILIQNDTNISPIPLELTEQMLKDDISSWFKLKNNSPKNISISDYLFRKIKEESGYIHVEATINTKNFKGNKKYIFKIPEKKSIHLQSRQDSKESFNFLTERINKTSSGLGYLLLGGGFTTIASKIFYLTRRKI